MEVFDVAAAEDGGVCADAVAAGDGAGDGGLGLLEDALAVDGLVVLLLHAVHVDDPAEILGGLDFLHDALHEQAVGAAVDEILAPDEFVDDVGDLGVDGGFAAGDGDDGCAGLFDGGYGFIDGHHLAHHGLVLADAATAYAGEVAHFEGFEHGDHGEALAALELLGEHVLGEAHGHLYGALWRV